MLIWCVIINKINKKMTVIILMMEAVSTSKTLVNVYQTTRLNIPENSHFHTRLRENLKYHQHY
jgi:hypothetical protein